MTTLLQIASRVEAAMEAYTPVRDFADQEKWRKMFKKELKKVTVELRSYTASPTKDESPLHPTLIALNIVLMKNEDLHAINRSHPQRKQHGLYNAEATFPEDISGLVDEDNRWWEDLAEADRKRHASQTTSSRPEVPSTLQTDSPPPNVPPAPQTTSPQPEGAPTLQIASSRPEVPPAPPTASSRPALQTTLFQPEAPPAAPTASPRPGTPLTSHTTLPQPEIPPTKLPRVNLVLPEQPAQGEEEPEEPEEGVPMDVDDAPQLPKRRGRPPKGSKGNDALQEPKHRGRPPKNSKGSPAKRKRKDSPAAVGGSSKRRAQSGGSGANSAEQGPDKLIEFQCVRCAQFGETCKVDPDGGACGQCRQKKAKCSLVPRNAETGKADRHHYTQSEVLEYRLGLLETDAAPAPGEQGAVTKAGKRGAASAMEKQGVAAAKRKAVAKGKQPASPPKRSKRIRGSPEDDNEPGASDPAPSPSISLAALETLALESGGSSATNIAADSPATPPTLPKLRLPKRPALTAPEGSHTSQHSGFVVEVSAPSSKFLRPGRPHASHSSTDASLTSDSASITARVAALERKMELHEMKLDALDEWKRDVEKRLKELEA